MEDSRRRAKMESGIKPDALLMQKSPIMLTYPTSVRTRVARESYVQSKPFYPEHPSRIWQKEAEDIYNISYIYISYITDNLANMCTAYAHNLTVFYHRDTCDILRPWKQMVQAKGHN
jgi:hypothetical protein